MLSLESEMSLSQDEDEALAFTDESQGQILKENDGPGTYWLQLRPKRLPDEVFFVRMAWTDYPHSPPSVRFHDRLLGSFDVRTAWPTIPGYRPGSWDICKPFTAEGFAVHPEWSSGPHAWQDAGNPLLWVVQTLQFDLNNHFQVRA